MRGFNFLTNKQVYNETSRLDVLKSRGIEAYITDFAILSGGYVFNDNNKLLDKRKGYYFTKSDNGSNDVVVIDRVGKDITNRNMTFIGGRPVLLFNNAHVSNVKECEDNVIECEFGHFPQHVASELMQEELNEHINQLKMSGNKYTMNTRMKERHREYYELKQYPEYIYKGERYIRVKASFSNRNDDKRTMSNGVTYCNGDEVWVKVEPVKWLLDEKTRLMIAERIIFAGIQFTKEEVYKSSDFNNTYIKSYMNDYLSKELFQVRPLAKATTNIADELKLKKFKRVRKETYNFDFREVNEEDILEGLIKSDIPVFLHGKSGDGKSERVKQIDPNCIILYLLNVHPDMLNGKSVYDPNTKEMIDIKPTWLEKLEEMCAKDNDIHIVFFDELTNAFESVQGMVFNLILNKEVNGKWKLPKNARIVAAGNEMEESEAANNLVAPLHSRFAHIYINTTVNNWLKWALKNKIHPSIYGYIASKGTKAHEYLRTKYNGKEPNADPRKWEMASKLLYATNRPEMIRSLVGTEITKDFVKFCEYRIISIDDIINGNYTEQDLDLDVSEKYATAIGLSVVDDEKYGKVRAFVSKLGREEVSLFDTLWAKDNDDRLTKVATIREKENRKLKNEVER